MPNEISGTKMAIEIRNLSSNRTEAQEQRQVSRSVEKTDAAAVANNEAQNATSAADRVVLSDKAQEVQSLISSISEPPAINQERIEALRAAINSGTFTVSSEQIASKLLTIDFGNRNPEE